MTEERMLGGKVRKRDLPLASLPIPENSPELKRLDLPQGELAQVCPGNLAINYIAWVELKDGAVRGNHYHREKQEWIYLIRGEAELTIEDIDSRERETVRLQDGSLTVIEPGIAHALRPLGNGHSLEFSPQPFNAADTTKFALI